MTSPILAFSVLGIVSAYVVDYSEWILPILFLLVVAWANFNSPPTNRSGTSFALFFFGMIFYYAMLISLWLFVTVSVNAGSFIPRILGMQGGIEQYKPVVAALIVVAASQFPWVHRIDTAARSFCVGLAAIPREADRIAVELSQCDFQPKSDCLREQIARTISENIDPRALNFAGNASLAARFTRAVGLYRLFITPWNNSARPDFPAGHHARSAYAAIMHLGKSNVSRADERYEELMQAALAYFASPQPDKTEKDDLNRAIADLSNLVCSLIARYVLYCDKTALGRGQRLSNMGFDVSRPSIHSFGLDHWALIIVATMALCAGIMTLTPGTKPLAGTQVLSIAITFSLSMGLAVLGSIVVAQRFVERQENNKSAFPPIAELLIAALVVAGLSLVLRISIPLVPALFQGGDAGLQIVMTQFTQRWPGVIVPFTCTISLGLLCCYLGSLGWSWRRVSAVAAIANGLACMTAGFILAGLLDNAVLAQFYQDPDQATVRIVANTGLIGAAIGAMVLAAFRRSERVRRDVAEHAAAAPPPLLGGQTGPITDPVGSPRSTALPALGGYARGNVTELEGSYLCFRPAFSSSGVINAYKVSLHWDDAECCLMFEEQGRVDAGHTQKGPIYIPEGKPFLSLMTIERGAVRLIMVSRPNGTASARGLITTLSNPGGVQFTPVSAPLVLKRVPEAQPQLGFIKPNSPDYAFYRQELDAVMPDYGFFATPPGNSGRTVSAKAVSDGRFLVVNGSKS